MSTLSSATSSSSHQQRHTPHSDKERHSRDNGHKTEQTNKDDGGKGKKGRTEQRWDANLHQRATTAAKLTWLQVTSTRLSPKPGLTVLLVTELWDEGEVTGNLSIVGYLELLLLQLPELHVLKVKLQ